jgi:phosphoglycerol transferase MdoB-like AlkP superfamily enzyme
MKNELTDRLIERLFGPKSLIVLSVVGACLVLFLSEKDLATSIFVLFCFLTVFSFLFALSRRTKFSVIGTWFLFTSVTAISALKLKYMDLNLHVVDLYFYLLNAEVMNFLSASFLFPTLFSIAILALGGLLSWFAFRRERQSLVARGVIGFALLLSISGAALSYPRAAIESFGYYTKGHRTSSFFASIADAGRYLFYKPEFENRLSAVASSSAFDGTSKCVETTKRPDVIVVLMESAFPTTLFPEIHAPGSIGKEFQSADIRGLRVETFGGGTWITTAGLMTSLPTVEFGWMREYLSIYLQDRMHHSLPKLFKGCGYRTAAISPLPYHFVNEGPFLRSLGIDDYYDSRAIAAPSLQERDSFYFDAALKLIDQHRKTDARPLFLFMMTMATHSPYSFRFQPNTEVPGEPFGNDIEVDEYLRRLSMQRADFNSFIEKVKARTSRDGAVVLEFGDHQPKVTRSVADAETGSDSLSNWGSIAYLTYYRTIAIDVSLQKPSADLSSIDIAYLGPTLLEIVGLPRDDVYQDLLRLRDLCAGSFAGCPAKEEVELHLKKLVNGKLFSFTK